MGNPALTAIRMARGSADLPTAAMTTPTPVVNPNAIMTNSMCRKTDMLMTPGVRRPHPLLPLGFEAGKKKKGSA